MQHTVGRAATVAQLLQHPSRRSAIPEYLVDDRLLRRLQVLGGDLVVVDAVDRAHVLRRAHPHPVLRGLHAAVQLVEAHRPAAAGVRVGAMVKATQEGVSS
ncbi:hypothetical protein [Streptomyces sp. DH10]|uniref:hypothetical protein n=1 Tax=Streptomyces sp. DH10 TaxID=3040121 RepID=UPI003FA7C9CB